MGLTALVKILSSSADFTLHHRDAALKKQENGKIEGCSTTAVRLILIPSREEE